MLGCDVSWQDEARLEGWRMLDTYQLKVRKLALCTVDTLLLFGRDRYC